MTSELLKQLDLGKLSPKSKAILHLIGEDMTNGFRETEIASRLGRTPSWVSERLAELRQEILHQNGLLPPLTDAELTALRDDINTRGIAQPILVDEHLNIIDGRNRYRIADELQIPCPYMIVAGLTTNDKHELAVSLNATRRQLNRQQRRKLIECELSRDPNRSDRRIAGICGVHHSTVGTVRGEIIAADQDWRQHNLPARETSGVTLEPAADTPVRRVWTERDTQPAAPVVVDIRAQRETRVDTLGRQQPVARIRAKPQPKPAALLNCPCCDTTLELWRTADGYRLDHPAGQCAA